MEEKETDRFKETMEEVNELKSAFGINTTEAILLLINESVDLLRFHNTE